MGKSIWIFVVPPFDDISKQTNVHYSVLAVINPALCASPQQQDALGNRTCIVGMDSFGQHHYKLQATLVPYLRRYVCYLLLPCITYPNETRIHF